MKTQQIGLHSDSASAIICIQNKTTDIKRTMQHHLASSAHREISNLYLSMRLPAELALIELKSVTSFVKLYLRIWVS